MYVDATEPDPETGVRRQVSLNPRHSAGIDFLWEFEGRARLGLEAFYTGRQSLDDSPYLEESLRYWLFGVIGEWRVGRARIFVNAENLTDWRQTKHVPLARWSLGANIAPPVSKAADFTEADRHWMRRALELAAQAGDTYDEVPVGAVVVVDCRRLADSFEAVDYFETNKRIPYIVALNKFDGRLDYTLDQIREALEIGLEVPIIDFDARDRLSGGEVLKTLLRYALEYNRTGEPVG